jgi:thiol-disulfide isomerase/thioredoxin
VNNHLNPNFSHEDEEKLNPRPLPYKVSFFTKCVFLVIFGIGLSAYIYLLVERRILQSKFLLDNQMAAVKLTPSLLPPINVYDLKTNSDIILSSINDKWTLLNLWATWCPSCREEMPSLEFLQQKLKEKLNIVALSVDEDLDSVKDFINMNKPKFSVLWDKNHISSAHFGVEKYPETFLISPDGLLMFQISGPRDWSSPVAIDYLSKIIR